MANIPATTSPSSQQRKQLSAACENALNFEVSQFESVQLTQKEIEMYAAKEASFSPILIDNVGLSGGMKAYLLHPVKEILMEWRRTKSEFDDLLRQKLPAIDAVNRLRQEVEEAENERDTKCEEVEQRLEADEHYRRLTVLKESADLQVEDFKAFHGSRAARMFAWSPIYRALLVCIAVGVAAISYRDIYSFIQPFYITFYVVAIQAVLLVYAGHNLAKLLKQGRVRFGRYKRRRWAAVLIAILSILALVIAFAPAVAPRLPLLAKPISIFGTSYSFQVEPQTPAVLSLAFETQLIHLGAAFFLCFLCSLICHDRDPDYMAATRLQERRYARWSRRRRGPNRELARVKAKFAKMIDEKRSLAEARSQGVGQEMTMIEQIREHEKVVQIELRRVFVRNLDIYRATLFHLAQETSHPISFIRDADGSEITPYDVIHGRVTADVFQRLTSWFSLSSIRWPT